MTTSPEEKETVITFDESPAEAELYTHNRFLQKYMEEKLGLKPIREEGCTKVMGARTYRFPKEWFRRPRKPSQRKVIKNKITDREPDLVYTLTKQECRALHLYTFHEPMPKISYRKAAEKVLAKLGEEGFAKSVEAIRKNSPRRCPYREACSHKLGETPQRACENREGFVRDEDDVLCLDWDVKIPKKALDELIESRKKVRR